MTLCGKQKWNKKVFKNTCNSKHQDQGNSFNENLTNTFMMRVVTEIGQ